MLRNIIFTLSIFFLLITSSQSSKNVYIYATINDKIITNLDVEKEAEYLKFLNPKLNQLNLNKIIKIAKTSLINEIIKENEIKKIFEFDQENPYVSEYLKNLYTNLNFANEKDFENSLKKNKNYSLNDIKKKLKIEILWNELIYIKYQNQVKINKDRIVKKVENLSGQTVPEYLLSEIVFKKKANENLNELLKKIIESINQIGFNNTANIYSISDSSKMGGKIGWVKKTNLSKKIFEEVKNIEAGQFTKPILIGNDYIILKIEEIRSKQISLNKEEEIDKMINFETNKQLNKFSKIYFDKSKINYLINEK